MGLSSSKKGRGMNFGTVPADERAAVRAKLAAQKHAKLLLKTDQPAAYIVL